MSTLIIENSEKIEELDDLNNPLSIISTSSPSSTNSSTTLSEPLSISLPLQTSISLVSTQIESKSNSKDVLSFDNNKPKEQKKNSSSLDYSHSSSNSSSYSSSSNLTSPFLTKTNLKNDSKVLKKLIRLYNTKLKILEEKYLFSTFNNPPLLDSEIVAKPNVFLIGQYSTGKCKNKLILFYIFKFFIILFS